MFCLILSIEHQNNFHDATYAAEKERSVGLGVMGFHSYLQKNNIPLESVMSKVWNKKIFKKYSRRSRSSLKRFSG